MLLLQFYKNTSKFSMKQYFMISNLGFSEYSRGIPLSARKCGGKKVRFTQIAINYYCFYSESR